MLHQTSDIVPLRWACSSGCEWMSSNMSQDGSAAWRWKMKPDWGSERLQLDQNLQLCLVFRVNNKTQRVSGSNICPGSDFVDTFKTCKTKMNALFCCCVESEHKANARHEGREIKSSRPALVLRLSLFLCSRINPLCLRGLLLLWCFSAVRAAYLGHYDWSARTEGAERWCSQALLWSLPHSHVCVHTQFITVCRTPSCFSSALITVWFVSSMSDQVIVPNLSTSTLYC